MRQRVENPQAVLQAEVDLLKASSGNACDLAVNLGNEGVKNAKCGDALECALAQHFANKTGYVASVCGSSVQLFKTSKREDGERFGVGEPVATAKLGGIFAKFVQLFDQGKYKFLASRKSLMEEGFITE